MDSYKTYYRALIKTFGNANYIGCSNLARVLAEYTEGAELQKIYSVVASDISSTPTAVERSIRIYLKAILQDYTLDDIATMLDYTFKPGRQNLIIGEFVPIFKFHIENATE